MSQNLKLQAIRGAITAKSNTQENILENTKILLNTIFRENRVLKDDIVSIIFTLTEDLDATYPAKAARELGITDKALMCARELPVPGSLNKCIRVMIHCYLDKKSKVKHIYLKEARKLRPDLVED